MKFMRLTQVGLTLLLGGAFAMQAKALPPANNLRDFDYIQRMDGWLTSYNAAGLLSLPVAKVSFVEASFAKTTEDSSTTTNRTTVTISVFEPSPFTV